MSIRLLILLSSILLTGEIQLEGQAKDTQEYFQQKVDYKIKAHLDTLTQTLKVRCNITYTNNSKQDIDKIYFHLWWNAYNDKRSAFAKQKLKLADRDFYFAKEKDLGGYQEISFQSQGTQLETQPYIDEQQTHTDIIELPLNKSIAPGSSEIIVIDYTLDIPKLFSRGGFDGELYRFCQWYPKPAVFDNDGWHPMPYLELGEYYSEYGDYEVELTLPEAMQVVATGLESNVTETTQQNNFSYNAKDVHDFAWFCSSRYNKTKTEVKIADKQVDLFLLTNHDTLQQSLLAYAERALLFYSDQVSPYPYPQMSVVINKKDNGSGMEYPMITIIDQKNINSSLDHLIAHEIGHNWFYGVLGSNERDHAWMDEGLNSFYDHKYHQRFYEEVPYNHIVPDFIKDDNPEFSDIKNGIRHLNCSNRLCAINKSVDEIHPVSYAVNSYERMVMNLEYLESYLGEKSFQKCIKRYYSEWANKHPQPRNIQYIFENESSKNLGWFFNGLLADNSSFDYYFDKVVEFKSTIEVSIKNKTDFNPPFHVTSYSANGELLNNQWLEAEDLGRSITLTNNNISKISINGQTPFLDRKRRNNHYYLNRLFPKRRKLKLNTLFSQNESEHYEVNWFPAIGYNKFDGLGLGLQLSNSFYPYNSFRWYFSPSIGLKSKEPIGIFSIEKDFTLTSNKGIRKWTLGLYGKKFTDQELSDRQYGYFKLVPSLRLHFEKDMQPINFLEYKLHYLKQIKASDSFGREGGIVHQINYKRKNRKGLSTNSLSAQLAYENFESFAQENISYLKLSIELKKEVFYNENSQFLFRFFGGYFVQNSNRQSSAFLAPFGRAAFALTQQGESDYLYEDYFLGRSVFDGLLSRQINITNGGFKLPTSAAFNIGYSNDLMATSNFKVDLPFRILKLGRIRPYLDLGLVSTKAVNLDDLEMKFFYGGGLAFETGDFLGIYIPLLYSSEFKTAYSGLNILEKISFRINLDKLNFWQKADDPVSLLYW